ncbi:MAG: lytic transglycosylase domain-containing protein [Candidatus Hydrogenedentota bacterium]
MGNLLRQIVVFSVGLAGLILQPICHANDEANHSYFVDASGVPILTNQPHEYRGDERYREVKIEYKAIYAPRQYDFGASGSVNTEADYRAVIRRYARHYRLNPSLLTAIIKAESNFDRFAVSKSGAQGLMQLMPATAEEMSVSDPYDPTQNIAGGSQYLYRLLQLFDDDLDLALAAYNAGPGAVQKYGSVPPYPETQAYVNRVKQLTLLFASGRERIQVNSHTYRPNKRFKPTAEAPFVVHFKSGRSQPAHHVTELGDEYILTSGRRRFSIQKTLVERVERLR